MRENNIKEQAKWIIDLFDLDTRLNEGGKNKCAEISIDIVIDVLRQQIIDLSQDLNKPLPIISQRIEYWRAVQEEIKIKNK